MKKLLLVLGIALLAGCSPKVEEVQIIKGDDGKNGRDGISCSVAPEVANDNEEQISQVIGARISCTDGSYSVVLNGQNGTNGTNGLNGQDGAQGIQGPVGQTGAAAQACQVYRVSFLKTTFLSCPGQWPVAIYDGKDGKDGEDGKDGASCSSERQDSKNRVKITCANGNHVVSTSYVYDGQNGQDGKDGKDGKTGPQGPAGTNGSNGKSCTATRTTGGANIKCGSDAAIFLADGVNGSPGANGTNGTNGTNGQNGQNGQNGTNGVDGDDAFTPGLSCDVHNLPSWDGSSSLPQVFVGHPTVGTFSLAALNIPNTSQNSSGHLLFPGMPSSIQHPVAGPAADGAGYVAEQGYALDCTGYLNVPTSGTYTLNLLSDDGSELRLNNQTVATINNQGLHAPQTVSATVQLDKGPNKINVTYYQGPYSQIALELSMSGPNYPQQVVPAALLTH